jgi:hydroxymethylbilane synthase
MRTQALRIGTRASALALWQAEHVAALLRAQGAPPVHLVHIKTAGDLQSEVPLWQAGGQAFFTKEIDRALIEGTVDLAVHSLKDLSTQLQPGLTLAATLARADARDALLSRGGVALADLPPGARIGTSSLRRRAFLRRARPDLQQVELRGNVPTRVQRLRDGDDYEAIILAAAGLARLDLLQHVTEYLPAERFPPAVSQGVIGVCARSADAATLRWLLPLDDREARLASSAERALLKRLQGGCQVPLGALATVNDRLLKLQASVCALDGTRQLVAQGAGPASIADAVALGERVADELLARGAGELIAHERTRLTVAAP